MPISHWLHYGDHDLAPVCRSVTILCCNNGEVTFRDRDSASQRFETRTVRGATFLWLVLQHVFSKGLRRARNFGFLHPNSKRLIRLLHYLLKLDPRRAQRRIRPRPALVCRCCGGPMKIVRTRIAPVPLMARRSAPHAIAAAAIM